MRKKIPRRERGAVFVEAIIVVSFFTLIFVGLVYFRTFYLTQLKVMRLARASSIAYTMGACTANDPAAWASSDIKGSTQSTGQTKTTSPTSQSTATQGSPEAQAIMKDLPGGGNDDGIMNPIGNVGLSEVVRAGMKTALRTSNWFESTPRATSYVSCGDKVRDGSFDEVLGYVKDHFPAAKFP
jgi:hypothetical protein